MVFRMLEPWFTAMRDRIKSSLSMVLGKVLRLYQNGEKDCNIFTLKARRQDQEQEKHISLF
jgi:hypothetical protein